MHSEKPREITSPAHIQKTRATVIWPALKAEKSLPEEIWEKPSFDLNAPVDDEARIITEATIGPGSNPDRR